MAISLVLTSAMLSACIQPAGGPRLRIRNAGAQPIENLVVLFPEARIEFGDVAAGATTEYLKVPNGVYSYAAYEYEVNGETIVQPVIDWVGEQPMQGSAFTYTVDFDPARTRWEVLQLVEVTRDE